MIKLNGVTKSFGSVRGGAPNQVLGGIDLEVGDHEFVCLLGPSGCGKTTLLEIVAGLMRPDAGRVEIDGRAVDGPGPDRAMVFQDFALLPWADVETNVAFGLEARGMAKAERLAAARALIAKVGLAGFERHYPGQLSGGMQQRVGLARALAVGPRVLLMDEPFSSLDSLTRRLTQEDLLALHAQERHTVLFVTHSVDEAVRLGDRVVRLTRRPARVAEIVETGLSRPRPPRLGTDPRFVELKEHLWTGLRAGEASR